MNGNPKKHSVRVSEMTRSYYDEHAQEFFDQTVSVNMEALYAPFLDRMLACAHILDAGCGSGRDTLHFLKLGYKVTAFDASQELAKLASRLTGQDVLNLRFDQIEFDNIFDGIWACASLLHVSRRDLGAVLNRLTRALKPQGVIFASFKLRDQEWEENGRFFNGYNLDSFELLLRGHPNLAASALWVSEDVRPARKGEKWMNALLRRTS
jgi:SAM-dependent methyltransferase